jgi:DNA-binding NarL/FixJ family response regulator
MLYNYYAEALFLSVHTVNTHRQRILSKTGTSSMTEAVRWAMERGLLA